MTHTVDASDLSSPYRFTDVMVDEGVLSFHISDPAKDAEFERTKLVEAVLITESRKQIILKLWATNHGNGVTFLFKLKDVGFDDDHFDLWRVALEMSPDKKRAVG